MTRIRNTLATLATMATALAGAALLSGWMTVAVAGGVAGPADGTAAARAASDPRRAPSPPVKDREMAMRKLLLSTVALAAWAGAAWAGPAPVLARPGAAVAALAADGSGTPAKDGAGRRAWG